MSRNSRPKREHPGKSETNLCSTYLSDESCGEKDGPSSRLRTTDQTEWQVYFRSRTEKPFEGPQLIFPQTRESENYREINTPRVNKERSGLSGCIYESSKG